MNKDEFGQMYARYLAEELTDEERRAFEQSVLADPELSAEFYADQGIRSELRPTGVVKVPAHWWRWAAPVAAAALVLIAINFGRPSIEEPGPVMRGNGSEIEVSSPLGAVDSVPTRFSWAAVEGAAGYRLEILDDQARVVMRRASTINEMVIAEGVPDRGTWRVVALDASGREIAASAFGNWSIEQE